MADKPKNIVKDAISAPKALASTSIGTAVGTGVVIAGWQAANVGGWLQRMLMKVPLVRNVPFLAKMGAPIFQISLGTLGLIFRRKKGFQIEKAAYAVMLINGVVDGARSIIATAIAKKK